MVITGLLLSLLLSPSASSALYYIKRSRRLTLSYDTQPTLLTLFSPDGGFLD